MLTGNLQIKKLSHYFLITILWCLCVGVLAFFSVDVSAQSAETVKVGYYFSNNFQEGMDDRSPKSGYSYEYLQKLASYTGWKYEYVYGEWDELFEKLKDGEIDLMAVYSDDRVDQVGYPDSDECSARLYKSGNPGGRRYRKDTGLSFKDKDIWKSSFGDRK